MQLNAKQIKKIKQTIQLDHNKSIVRIDVSEEKEMPVNESNFNIYCIGKNYEIIWQVKEIKTKPTDDSDMFVYLSKNQYDEIIADRFSGFEYKINPETGEATQIGFHK